MCLTLGNTPTVIGYGAGPVFLHNLKPSSTANDLFIRLRLADRFTRGPLSGPGGSSIVLSGLALSLWLRGIPEA